VSSGFTSAVALVILSSQVKDLLGIPAKGNTFVEMWTEIFENIGSTRLWDTVLGASCIIVLLLLRVKNFLFLLIFISFSVSRNHYLIAPYHLFIDIYFLTTI
jgi:MFS superfamily sulfate permease-like transporter